MVAQTDWHGTNEERDEFLAALNRNCLCKTDEFGAVNEMCAVHTALLHDQQWLDRMVFFRRLRDKLKTEERRRGKPWHSI